VPIITIVLWKNCPRNRQKDEELQELLKDESALILKEFTLSGSTIPLYCNCSKGAIRSYVPGTLRNFNAVHGMAHPSGKATKHQIEQKFVWPGINRNITYRHVPHYQRSKTQ